MNDSFWIGVTSGIVTTIILYIFRQLFGQLISGLAGVFVRSIKGTWIPSFKKGGDFHNEQAEVYQIGPWVWGKIRYSTEDKNREYKFKGTLRSEVLVATYEIENPISIDRGAFTLHLNNDGDVMTGKYSWTDSKTTLPAADEYIWRKVKS